MSASPKDHREGPEAPSITPVIPLRAGIHLKIVYCADQICVRTDLFFVEVQVEPRYAYLGSS